MLLSLEKVGISFGVRTLLSDANWTIQAGERIGLIGANGTGKSTLLKILMGTLSPTEGKILRSNQLTLGFLHQDLLGFPEEESIIQIVVEGNIHIAQLKKNIQKIEEDLATRPNDETLLLRYADTLSTLQHAGGYDSEHKAERILEGLGFNAKEQKQPYKAFSGGWKMRVLLARIILQNPDILLLDEPTNHLDLPSIQWLENFLKDYKGAVILVSHDRFFLNRVVTKIVAVKQEQLHFYTGNYDDYEEQKESRDELQEKAYQNQQRYIKQQERFIERFKAKASKASQAQSIQKRLDKTTRIAPVSSPQATMKLCFQITQPSGKVVATLDNISHHFGTKTLLRNSNAQIFRGDSIALLGANGIGKSTLLNIISGKLRASSGTIQFGYKVQFSHYAQHQLAQLHENNTIFEEVSKSVPLGITDQDIRNSLGAFLFSGENIDKPIHLLSGGERARVSLCKVMLSKANFLLLDEPTNHLDIPSIQVLIKALQNYEGTLLFVSHNRHFIQSVARSIWYVKEQDIKTFTGTFEEWEYAMQQEEKRKEITEKRITPQPSPIISTNNNEKEKKQIERKMTRMELDLQQLKKEQLTLTQTLTDLANQSHTTNYKNLQQQYQDINNKIAALEQSYETLFESLWK